MLPLPLLLLACAPAPPKQPDLVLVVVDTLRADHLGAYGYDRPTSPHIDRLAQRGALFSRAYAQAGWTLASVASLLTGQYPHQHRAVRHRQRESLFGEIAPETTTLAEALQAAGYATAAVVNNPFLKPGLNIDQGFEVFDVAKTDRLSQRSARETVATGLAWLEAQEKPAFLFLHFIEPHLSYDPPDALRGTFAPRDNPPVPVPFTGDHLRKHPADASPEERDYIVRLYDEEVLAVDQAMGELVAALEERRAWDETLLVFTADHGEELWDHGGFEHGHTLYGELVHVPLIVAGAGAPKGRVETLVEHVDLFQGLIARGGATRPPGSMGEDLWALAKAPPTTPRHALSESVVRGPPLVSVADERHRLVVSMESRVMEAWTIAPDGVEREQVDPLQQEEVGRGLFRALFDRRGGMAPVVPNLGEAPLSDETTEQLRLLGYVEEESAPEGG